ncbi:hypothetical protein [Peribacillus simplex]|uniref:hypothetical protein n=1 Tax=Peribacillus simplex TaxID=1478 RepID=UPI003D2CC105
MKKFATLLPNYWLAETPQALALMRLGRQSAESERISEINSDRFFELQAFQGFGLIFKVVTSWAVEKIYRRLNNLREWACSGVYILLECFWDQS